jgi:hypothetical protein
VKVLPTPILHLEFLIAQLSVFGVISTSIMLPSPVRRHRLKPVDS